MTRRIGPFTLNLNRPDDLRPGDRVTIPSLGIPIPSADDLKLALSMIIVSPSGSALDVSPLRPMTP